MDHFEKQPDRTFRTGQCPQNQYRRKDTGKFCGKSHPARIRLEYDHKKQIEQNIGDAGNGDEQQRPFGIAHRPQNGSSDDIKDRKRQPDTADLKIKNRFIQYIIRRPHQRQRRTGKQNSEYCRCDPAVYTDRNGCMDHPGNFFMIFRADIPGGNGVHSGTESIEKNDQHDIQCGTRTHCRSGNGTDFLRSELTEDDKICRIKKQTDDTGPHQRERETENLAEKRAMTHIDLIFFIAVHCKMPCFFIFG